MNKNDAGGKEYIAKRQQEQEPLKFLVDDYHKPIRPLSGTGIIISVLKEYPNGLTLKEIASHMEKIKPDLKVKSFEGRAEHVVNNWLIKSMNYAIIEDGIVRLIRKSGSQLKSKVHRVAKVAASKDRKDKYLPTKNDCERAIKKISRSTAKTEFDLEELFIELKKASNEKGKTLKSNWKIITEENLKIWFI